MYRSDYCYECGIDIRDMGVERLTGLCPICEDKIKEEKTRNTIDN